MPAAADPVVAPAHLWLPAHVSSAGGEAADFAASLGITLDPEQRLVLDTILAERADGRWAAFETAVICSRQNLKTFVFQVVALADLFLFGAELIVWTAHLFPTTMEAFRAVKAPLEAYDHLRRRVRRISEANGEEGIELVDGRRLLFKARTKSGGRGLTGDRVILDEAFALGASEMGSLLPTLSARPNPQVVYGSSAGLLTSEVLRGVRDRGRAGGDPTLAYIEWCAPTGGCVSERCDHRVGADGCVLDDVEAWRQANPALGRRISVDHIAAERRALPPAEFARERLGWWEDPDKAGAALPLDAWLQCRDRASQAADIRAFAFDVAPDSSWSAIAVAGVRADGLAHVEVVDYRPGTDWLASRLLELVDRYGVGVAMDGKGPGAALLDELADAGVTPTLMGTGEIAQACGGLVDRLVRRSLRHLAQPELDTAVRGAVRRQFNDAWMWSRRQSPVEISPLVAVTLALGAPGAEQPGEVNLW